LINLNIFKDIFKYYDSTTVASSVFTGFLFFLFPASGAIALAVNLIMLNFYRFYIFYAFLYLVLVLLTYFSNHITVVTLKNYKEEPDFNYNLLKSQLTVFSSFGILFIFIAILLIFF